MSGLRRGLAGRKSHRVAPRKFVKIKPCRKIYRGEASRGNEGELKEMTVVEVRIKDLLLKIGNGEKDEVGRNLNGLAQALQDDLELRSGFITGMLLECAEVMPHKANVYGCLTALLAKTHPEFAKEVAKSLQAEMQSALDTNPNSRGLRILLRFACGLANAGIFSSEGVVKAVGVLIRTASSEELPQAVKDQILYSALSSLPHLDAFFPSSPPPSDTKQSEASPENSARSAAHSLVREVGDVVKGRSVPLAMIRLAPLDKKRNSKGSIGPESHPKIEQNSNIKATTPEDSLNRIYRLLVDIIEGKEGCSEKPKTTVRPQDDLELKVTDGKHVAEIVLNPGKSVSMKSNAMGIEEHGYVQYPLKLFPNKYDKDISELERVMAVDIVDDVVHLLKESNKATARVLTDIRLGLPSYKHLVMEGLVGSLLALPRPVQPVVWHASVVYEAFRLDAKTMAPLFAVSIQSLFKKARRLDIELIDRSCQWFALHVSNFNFQWFWNTWTPIVDLPELDKQRLFVVEILRRCVRLSGTQTPGLPHVLRVLEPPPPTTKFLRPGDPFGLLKKKKRISIKSTRRAPMEEEDKDTGEDTKVEMEDEAGGGESISIARKDKKTDTDQLRPHEKAKVPQLDADIAQACEDFADMLEDRRPSAVVASFLEKSMGEIGKKSQFGNNSTNKNHSQGGPEPKSKKSPKTKPDPDQEAKMEEEERKPLEEAGKLDTEAKEDVKDDTKSQAVALEALKWFFPCFLEVGRHSITHWVTLLTRYRTALRLIVSSPRLARAALDIAAAGHIDWEARLVSLVGKLMHHAIVHPKQVSEWALGMSTRPLASAEVFGRFFRFELVRNAAERALMHRRLALSKSIGVDDMGKQQPEVSKSAQRQTQDVFLTVFAAFVNLTSDLHDPAKDPGLTSSSEHTKNLQLGRLREVI
ncbi:hypothetical protein AAMO2058_000269600 [Amorphochlora amoebiformis]